MASKDWNAVITKVGAVDATGTASVSFDVYKDKDVVAANCAVMGSAKEIITEKIREVLKRYISADEQIAWFKAGDKITLLTSTTSREA